MLDSQDQVKQHGPFWAEGLWSFKIGFSIGYKTEQSNLRLLKTLKAKLMEEGRFVGSDCPRLFTPWRGCEWRPWCHRAWCPCATGHHGLEGHSWVTDTGSGDPIPVFASFLGFAEVFPSLDKKENLVRTEVESSTLPCTSMSLVPQGCSAVCFRCQNLCRKWQCSRGQGRTRWVPFCWAVVLSGLLSPLSFSPRISR